MKVSKLSTQELLRLCLVSNDPEAWHEFVRRFQPLIARVVVKSIRRWTDPAPSLADELVQETYLKLIANDYRALRTFDLQHENAFLGFLKVVASNVVQDHFRSSYSSKRGSGHTNEDIEAVGTSMAANTQSSGAAERRILISEIQRCLETQRAEPNFSRDQAIFWLYYEQGLTAKAISELPAIGLTVKGVESTLLRLTRYVRERMNAKSADLRKDKLPDQASAAEA